jgi:hypothetical protein
MQHMRAPTRGALTQYGRKNLVNTRSLSETLLVLSGVAALLVLLKRRPKLVDDHDAGAATPVSVGVGKPVGLVR